MSIEIVQHLDLTQWRDSVDNHPHGNVFHTPEMFQVFTRAKGHQPTLWAAVNDRRQVLALLLPVLVTLKSGLLHRLTTRAIAYGSVLCAPEPEGPAALATLLKAYVKTAKRQTLFAELRHLSDIGPIQPVLAESRIGYQVYRKMMRYLPTRNRESSVQENTWLLLDSRSGILCA